MLKKYEIQIIIKITVIFNNSLNFNTFVYNCWNNSNKTFSINLNSLKIYIIIK